MKQYVEIKMLIAFGLCFGLLWLLLLSDAISSNYLLFFFLVMLVSLWWGLYNTYERQFKRLMKKVAKNYSLYFGAHSLSADVGILPYEYGRVNVLLTEGLTIHYKLIMAAWGLLVPLVRTTVDVEVSLKRVLPLDVPHQEAIDSMVNRVNQALDGTEVQQLDACSVTYTSDAETLRIAILIPGQHATTTRLRSLQNALIAAFV